MSYYLVWKENAFQAAAVSVLPELVDTATQLLVTFESLCKFIADGVSLAALPPALLAKFLEESIAFHRKFNLS